MANAAVQSPFIWLLHADWPLLHGTNEASVAVYQCESSLEVASRFGGKKNLGFEGYTSLRNSARITGMFLLCSLSILNAFFSYLVFQVIWGIISGCCCLALTLSQPLQRGTSLWQWQQQWAQLHLHWWVRLHSHKGFSKYLHPREKEMCWGMSSEQQRKEIGCRAFPVAIGYLFWQTRLHTGHSREQWGQCHVPFQFLIEALQLHWAALPAPVSFCLLAMGELLTDWNCCFSALPPPFSLSRIWSGFSICSLRFSYPLSFVGVSTLLSSAFCLGPNVIKLIAKGWSLPFFLLRTPKTNGNWMPTENSQAPSGNEMLLTLVHLLHCLSEGWLDN